MVDNRCGIWYYDMVLMFFQDISCYLLFFFYSKIQEDKVYYKCRSCYLVQEIWFYFCIGILYYKGQLYQFVYGVYSIYQEDMGGIYLKIFYIDKGDMFYQDMLYYQVLLYYLDSSVQVNKELNVLQKYLYKCSQLDIFYKYLNFFLDYIFFWGMFVLLLFLWDKNGFWDKFFFFCYLLGVVLQNL